MRLEPPGTVEEGAGTMAKEVRERIGMSSDKMNNRTMNNIRVGKSGNK